MACFGHGPAEAFGPVVGVESVEVIGPLTCVCGGLAGAANWPL